MTTISPAPRLSRRTALVLAGLGAGAPVLAACGNGDGGSGGGGGLTVVTSCYPLRFLVARIAGDQVSLLDLAAPGADAHGLELSVRQVVEVQSADLVLQIPGFQPPLDEAIASAEDLDVVDVSAVTSLLAYGEEAGDTSEHDRQHDEDAHQHESGESHEGENDHGPLDPHFWHDPLRMAEVGDAVAEKLSAIAPDQAGTFTAAAAELRTELEQLDAELAAEFEAAGGSRTFITSHAAYRYLAESYQLRQIGIAGVDPETEPSPQRLLELESLIDEEGVTTIFFESTASPKVAQALADNVGIDSAELDNLETQLDEQEDYPAVMRSNSQALIASWT